MTIRGAFRIENFSTPAFYGGTPLWQLVQKHGMKSASYFWVGSEAPVLGSFPDYFYNWDATVPNQKRIDQAIEWLRLPEKERPHLITLYFSLVDNEGHNSGPNSKELQQTVLQADSLLGNLMDRLKGVDLPVNVIVVSDHGMLELKQEPQTYITLSSLFNIADTSIVYASGGTQAHFYTDKVDSLYNVLKANEKHFRIYKREEFPARWHYDHDRAGDLLLVVDPWLLHPGSRTFLRQNRKQAASIRCPWFRPWYGR